MLTVIINRLPMVRKIVKENKQLKKYNQLYLAMYQEECKKNEAYHETLEELVAELQKNKNCTGAKKALPNKIEFEKTAMPDDAWDKAAESMENNPFGMAAFDYSGEPIKYKELSLREVNELFDYCYANSSKEVNLDLGEKDGKKIAGILEGHNDNTVSVEIYEDKKHLKRMQTGRKMIGEEVISDYDVDDIIDVLNTYGRSK